MSNRESEHYLSHLREGNPNSGRDFSNMSPELGLVWFGSDSKDTITGISI